jgi:aspartyl-tRNA(Asn)/glutamyl-tRNA(Gln) amidotransferase subunit A
VDPGLLAIAEQGARYSRAELQDAALERGELGVRMQAFLADYDLLVTPTLARPAFAVGLDQPEDDGTTRWIDWAGFSYPFNLTQQPAISVPAGFTKGGLPVGLQLVAAKHADALVLQAGRAFESACPQPMPEAPRPPKSTAAV